MRTRKQTCPSWSTSRLQLCRNVIPVYTHGEQCLDWWKDSEKSMTAVVPWIPIPYDRVTDVKIQYPRLDTKLGSTSTFTGSETLRESFAKTRQLPLRFQSTLLSRVYYASPSQKLQRFTNGVSEQRVHVCLYVYL